MNRTNWIVIAVLAAIVLIGGVWLTWPERARPAPEVAPLVPAPVASAPADVAVVPAPAPLPEPPPPPPEQALTEADLGPALSDALGRRVESTPVQTDGFVRRFVATIDNLARDQAPPIAWPVTPTPGRFTVEEVGGQPVIGAANAARYDTFVRMVDEIDPKTAVDIYVRMQPMLQQAYAQLGYPGKRFYDQLLQTIDRLLATPEPAYPVKLELTEVRGPVASTRPWVRYRYADPQLEALSAGQKILIRVGPDHARRLKAKLRAIRAELVARGAQR